MKKVGIAYSDNILIKSKNHPKFGNRYELVISLIKAYGLLKYAVILSSNISSNLYSNYINQLKSYHSIDYLKTLLKLSSEEDENTSINDDILENYGLLYDCHSFTGVFDFCISSVSNTITIAKALTEGEIKIGINWHGGWHHAHKDEAAGFCYMNDIVYGIMILLKQYNRVLYIDIDLHLGDGVEEAFLHTDRVFTLSLHHSVPGFFPSTCCTPIPDSGFGKGRFCSARVGFKNEGVNDKVFCDAFDRAFNIIYPIYQPKAVVLQCGTDGLVADPHGIFSLTSRTYEHVVRNIMEMCGNEVPLMILGGGGYNFVETARVWTKITALVLKQTIPSDIPDHEYLEKYGPCYDIETELSNRKYVDEHKSIDSQIEYIQHQMDQYAHTHQIK